MNSTGMTSLAPGVPVDVNALPLRHSPVAAGQLAAGRPGTALHELGRFAGAELGVWEMTSGAMHDVEAEEVFLVTAGRATVEIHSDGAPRTLALSPGSLVRLNEGMRTTWTVHDTLRKVYLGIPD